MKKKEAFLVYPVEVKTLREPVGLVFFIFYDFLYFFPGFWCNIFRVIQYPGYGSNRNPRGLGNLFNIHELPSPFHLVL